VPSFGRFALMSADRCARIGLRALFATFLADPGIRSARAGGRIGV